MTRPDELTFIFFAKTIVIGLRSCMNQLLRLFECRRFAQRPLMHAIKMSNLVYQSIPFIRNMIKRKKGTKHLCANANGFIEIRIKGYRPYFLSRYRHTSPFNNMPTIACGLYSWSVPRLFCSPGNNRI